MHLKPSRTQIGPYQVLELLAVGCGPVFSGEVFKARDAGLDRTVVIRQMWSADSELTARFERWAKAIAALTHPNICAIHDVFHENNSLYFVLEWLQGETLAQRIAKGPISVDEALKFAIEIADALNTAHRAGIVHRDLKPDEIMVTKAGVKLLPWKMAKVDEHSECVEASDVSQSPTITPHAGTIPSLMGTAAYMSPERVAGKRVDDESNTWAFACIFYEMVSGRRAFGGDTTSDTVARILEGEPDWREIPASVPREIRDLLVRCLKKDQKRRLRDIRHARIAIEDLWRNRGALNC